MIRSMRMSILLLFLLSIVATLSLHAQPDTIYIDAPTRVLKPKSQRELKDEEKFLRRLEREEIHVQQAVLLETGRFASARFPALTFTYQRMLGNRFSAVGSVGIPINNIDVYRELTGPLTGIEARLGAKVYLSKSQDFRLYFSVDGWAHINPVRANTYVQEPDKPSFRLQELNLDRKRQIAVPSFGFQSIGLNGFTVDFQLGVVAGRRGIFSEGNVNYLSSVDDPFFGAFGIDQNEWVSFFDLRIGLAIGYAF